MTAPSYRGRVGDVVVGNGAEGLVGLPVHVWGGRCSGVPVGLDEGEGVHVEVVARLLAERRAGGHELGDERTVDARGVEGREGLGELAGLHGLVSHVLALETLADE